MTAQYLGDYSIGALIPQLQILQLELLLDLQTKLEAAIAAQLSITLTPPSLSLSLQAALDLVVSLKAAIAIGLPDISIDLNLMVDIIAALKLKVELLLDLGKLLGVAGVLAFQCDANADRQGAELGAVITEKLGTQPCNSITLVATAPEVWVALGKILLTA